MTRRDILWFLACVIVSIGTAAVSALYPLGWAASYGPALEPCTPSSQGECIAPVELSKTI